MKTLQEIVQELEPQLQCNCDLDRWQPETDTGHSWVCRIHKKAKVTRREQWNNRNKPTREAFQRGVPGPPTATEQQLEARPPYFLAIGRDGCILYTKEAECIAEIPDKDRAEFILKAVSSHEKLTKDRGQLLKALKGLEALINDPDVNCRIRYDVGDLKRWGDYWVLAIAAIEEAEKSS